MKRISSDGKLDFYQPEEEEKTKMNIKMRIRILINPISKLHERIFQKDYWSMDDIELANEASKHNIPHVSMGGEHREHWYMDRAKIINQLISRDNALRTKQSTILSITALLISMASLVLNYFR
jgi:hypothetical protein